MLIILFGITGSGKSYFKDQIAAKLNFKKIAILTNRLPRTGEISGVDKIFCSNEELQAKIDNDEIAYYFDFMSARYAYLNKDLLTDENSVVEMNHQEIDNLKAMLPNITTIYLKPNRFEKAVEFLKARKSDPKAEKERLEDMQEEYNLSKDKDFQKKFDYIFSNNYDDESTKRMIELIRNQVKK